VQDPRAVYLDSGTGIEQRFAAISMSIVARVLFVVHVEREDRDRIVSARLATASEEELYSHG
jgi:uncharacterized DUF497 family protein